MGDLAAIRSDILVELDRPDLTDIVSSNLGLAINHYERLHFWFNEDVSTASLATSQEFLAITSNFVFHISFSIQQGAGAAGLYKPLIWINHERHESQHNNLVNGEPREFSILGNRIRIFPTADQSYNSRLAYIKTLPLTTLAASNAWTNELKDLIKYRTQRVITATVLQDFAWSAQFKELELECLERARMETLMRTGLGLTKRWPDSKQ